MLNTFEKWLAIVLIALSLFHVGQMTVAMATSSLSTDEYGTVGSFSSKGPLHVMTDYRAPKNHVFFNLLNSILPGRESLDPTRVRSLSILATMLTALVLIAYAAWRGRWMESAVLLALWNTAPQALQLSMEARGYGFLGLFAVLATLATLEYATHRDRKWLWALGVSVALGVYTIPGFLFFAGPLMLLLWLVERTRVTFFAGAITGGAILLLYAPLLGEVFSAFTGFHQDKDEADFVSAHALVRASKLYLFQSEDWEAWSLLAMLALAPFATPAVNRREITALRVVTGSCLIYFAILLALRTPPLRIAAFALLPLCIAGLMAIGAWFRKPAFLRMLVCCLIAIFLACHLALAIGTFRFLPTEDWSLAGRAIDAAFPKSTRIDFKRYAKYLQKTLPGAAERSSDYDDAAFASGGLVVADAGNKWAEGDRFVPPKGLSRVVQWTIPGTIRDIDLTFRLPEATGFPGAPAALTDGSIETGVNLKSSDLSLHVDPTEGAYSMIILLNRAVNPGEALRVDSIGGAVVAGNAVIVPLIPRAPADVRLHATGGSDLRAVEAWITR